MDPLELAFEGDFEGLVATTDDAAAILHGLELIAKYDSLATMQHSKLCVASPTRDDDRRARTLRKIKIRLIGHLQARAKRLQDVVIPELRRITQLTDRALCERESPA